MENRFQKFFVYLTKILRLFSKIRLVEMTKRGLKATDLNCLFFLKIMGGSATAHELSCASGEDKAAVSRTLSDLEKMGYVKSVETSKKKYNTQISLTSSGDIVAEEIVQKVNDFMEQGSEGISDSDREVFYATLETICKNLEKICQPYQNKGE